jgi:hypothetical protein
MSSEWLEFAKAALTGILANEDLGVNNSEVDIADMACDQADAMIAAIETRGDKL